MRFRRQLAVMTAVLLLTGAASVGVAQLGTGRVRGTVLDDSNAVVPGATVEVVVSATVVASAVTDERGQFEFPAVPAGPVTLRMSLDGFEASTMSVVVQAGLETWVSGLLRVARLSETVVVTAPAPPPPQPPPPPYEPVPVPLPDLETVCGPAKPQAWPTLAGRLGAHVRESQRVLYRLGDELAVESDAPYPLHVGQNLVARRYFDVLSLTGGRTRGEQTAGLIQVASIHGPKVTAVVIHACGEMRAGDLLMPFTPEPMPLADPPGVPVFRNPAKVLFGEADQMMGAPGRLMVIDRGQSHGLRPGQRVTLFRRAFGEREVVGDAVVQTVRQDSARIRVERATGVIWFGDSVALQRSSRQ